jgi:hypothetical protein
MKADVKTTKKSLMKKRDIVIKSSSSFDNEVSLLFRKITLFCVSGCT